MQSTLAEDIEHLRSQFTTLSLKTSTFDPSKVLTQSSFKSLLDSSIHDYLTPFSRNKDLVNLKQDISTLHEEIRSVRDSNDHISSDFSQLIDSSSSLSKSVSNLENEIASIQEDQIAWSKQLSIVQTSFNKKTSELNSSISKITSSIEKSISDAVIANNEIRNWWEGKIEGFNEKLQDIYESIDKIDEYRDTVYRWEGRISELKAKMNTNEKGISLLTKILKKCLLLVLAIKKYCLFGRILNI